MEHVRRLSKQLFGAFYRLEVSAALQSGQVVTLSSFAATLTQSPSMSCIAKELQVLEATGLLERQPNVEGMRNVYLRVIESPFWETCRELSKMVSPSLSTTGERVTPERRND
jgi:hypothetical protein